MQRVLDNPRSGERIVIRQSAADTDGQLLAFDLYLQPGGHVPAGHVHPRQEERFTIIRGKVRFRLARRTVKAGPGDTLVVPPGTAHWFGNAGDAVAHLRVEVRPALRMEELLETAVARAASRSAWWLRLLDQALIPFDYQLELGVPYIPGGVFAAVAKPLAWLRLRLNVATSSP